MTEMLYDSDVDSLEFMGESDLTVSISCSGQQIILAPGESGRLNNIGNKKFCHNSKIIKAKKCKSFETVSFRIDFFTLS